MTDHPIIFSAPMVRALLEGRKTQTRRLAWRDERDVTVSEAEMVALEKKGWQAIDGADEITTIARPSPWQRVQPGDRLWVREAFETGFMLDENERAVGEPVIWYGADGGPRWLDPDTGCWRDQPRWTPSIHMPRCASRLTLTVTEARIERLQAISEADAIAEGGGIGAAERHAWGHNAKWITGHCRDCAGWCPATKRKQPPCGYLYGGERDHRDHRGAGCSTSFVLRTAPEPARFSFEHLWDHLHGYGADAWDANPEVVALTFTVAQRNIDADA
jgi:hypothetical protein